MTHLQDTIVEIHLGTWTDITSYVLGTGSDHGGQIDINRGRPNETQFVELSRANMSLKNPDGRFCPRNPTGPYYGELTRNTPLRISHVESIDTTPQLDRITSSSNFATGDFNLNHTPAGDVKAVLVFISQNTGITDEVIGVVYGGVAMAEVTGSPLIHSTGAEDGTLYCYFLGADIPQGEQVVEIDVNATGSQKVASVISFTADSTTVLIDDTTTLDSDAVANPSVELTTTVKTLIISLLHSGHDSQASITATSPAVLLNQVLRDMEFDFGTQVTIGAIRTDAPAGNPTIGYTATAEEAGILAVALKNGPNILRASLEVPGWPVDWDTTGTSVWTTLEAAGVMRRLGQGAKPLNSALTRYVPKQANVRAYWPMEDKTRSSRFASGLPNGAPMLVSRAGIEYASQDGPPGSDSLPVWQQNGSAFGSPKSTSSPWRVDWVFFMGTAPASGGREMISIFTTSSSAHRWTMNCSSTGLSIDCEDDGGTSIESNPFGSIPADFYGNWHRCFISIRQSGSNVAYIAKIYSMEGVEEATFAATVSGTRSAGKPQRVGLYITSTDSRSIGHVTISNDDASATSDPFDTAYHGHSGELATDRVTRLCNEESITSEIVGATDDVLTMGPQTINTLLDLLRQCGEADGGILYEPRNFLGFAYRTRESLYNQTPKLILPYGAGLGSVPVPVDDDALIRNDVTATRTGGSSSRYVVEDGPLSVNPHPDGVGVYDTSVDVNVETDSMIDDQASWRAHLGTIDQYRFPVIHLGMSNQYWDLNPDQLLAGVRLDLGDRIDITDPPPWLPPDDIAQLVQGTQETLSNFTRDIRLNASPEIAWEVAVWATDAAVIFPGSLGTWADTPDTAVLDITGDIDLRAKVALDDWTPPSKNNWLISKIPSTGSERSYGFYIELATGKIGIQWSVDGSTPLTRLSTVGTGFSDQSTHWVRATLDVNNGAAGHDAKFYTSEDGVAWTQLGSTVTTGGTTSIASKASNLEIGARNAGQNGPMAGSFFQGEVRNGIAGSVVTAPQAGSTGITDPIGGLVYTLHGATLLSGAGGDRWDTTASELNSSFISGTDTSMSVAITDGPLWTTDAAEFPFELECGGARLIVTAISGGSSPQTFTIQQAVVNGVNKTIPAGTPVKLWRTPIWAL